MTSFYDYITKFSISSPSPDTKPNSDQVHAPISPATPIPVLQKDDICSSDDSDDRDDLAKRNDDNQSRLTHEERDEVRNMKHEMKEDLLRSQETGIQNRLGSLKPQDPNMERFEEMLEEHEHTREAQLLASAMEEWEYPFERHSVHTKSGWIIEMHRVKHGKGQFTSSNPQEPRPVVMLQHGLFNSSAAWLVTGPKHSIALKLADAGFDVWLGNNRGTHFARKHKRFNMKDPQFWNWSFQHMGLDDLPAQINFVLNHTRQEKLSYIGHSQGTAQAFVGFSSMPGLQDKVNLFVGLAPVTSLRHQRNHALRVLAKFKTVALLKWFGMGEFGHRSVSTSILPGIASSFKNRLMSKLNGLWSVVMDCNLDTECLSLLTQLEPSPTSLTNLAHWAFLVRSGRFCKRDLGKTLNEQFYGSDGEPHDYVLENIKIPVALFYGTLDLLSTPKDVEGYLKPRLQQVVYSEKYENYKHNDFIWSKASDEMHEKMLALLRTFCRSGSDPQESDEQMNEECSSKIEEIQQAEDRDLMDEVQSPCGDVDELVQTDDDTSNNATTPSEDYTTTTTMSSASTTQD
eukprot:CAMPEP_0117450636 /NCGR_PEP_ID=MMETSP0759-20121206/8576_1 /TAXON_ID=63605 /ORGANISM="Percolomonas cosmopolitus, Strain WS" /LENGTH=570 /DNA_ID=CAMNT_0005243175 /DNA_START=267 /DNA_END=1979 /DNA_ORIENTATION=-